MKTNIFEHFNGDLSCPLLHKRQLLLGVHTKRSAKTAK